MLIANYIKSAWRNILRHKLFSIINIMGLAIGLAAVMLIALYVKEELSYDKFWNDANRIYRVQMEYKIPGREVVKMTHTGGLTFNGMVEDFPEFEHIARINREKTIMTLGENVFAETVELVDPALIDIFNLTVISGSLKTALSGSTSIAINQSKALKIFGNQHPIGKNISIDFGLFQKDYTIAAVFKDIPKNSQLDINIITPIIASEWSERGWMFESWYTDDTEVYYKVFSSVNHDNLISKFPAFLDRRHRLFGTGTENEKPTDVISINPINIKDLHFKAEGKGALRPRGNQFAVLLFTATALLILIIASINFINLSTARANERAKEVSLRKLHGASRKKLISQFLGESIFLTFVSLLIALCITETTIPFYNQLLDKEISLDYTSFNFLIIILLTATVGFIGGIYPAFILSNFRPAASLHTGRSRDNKRTLNLRSILVVLQFSTSITLFVSTAVVFGQMTYVNSKNLGFEKENLLMIQSMDHPDAQNKSQLLLEEFRRLQETDSAAISYFSLDEEEETAISFRTPYDPEKHASMDIAHVGYDFFKTLRIPIILGRPYDKAFNDEILDDESYKGNIVINESALRSLGFESPEDALGKSIYRDIDDNTHLDYTIIGITPDIYFYSMRKELKPMLYFIRCDLFDTLYVRISNNSVSALQKIEQIWKQELPNIPLKYQFVSEKITNKYKQENGEAVMFATFSGLAIFIACLGLFGLAAFTAERRTKEIGIRKVFGAEVWQIVRMLVFQFSKPVLIANIIAWPIAYLAMSRWLESFVYRIDDMVIIALCLVAGLTALLIAWATVAGNSYAVARQNPIKALRYE